LGAGGREFESHRPDHLMNLEHKMPARIFKPSRNAMQSGKGKSDAWILEFEQSVKREADPLMGWTSAAETGTQVKLSFATKEEAETYAKSKGIAYMVQPEAAVRLTKKSYSDNFKFGRKTLWTH
jgi:ETC complex I subunit conserved region